MKLFTSYYGNKKALAMARSLGFWTYQISFSKPENFKPDGNLKFLAPSYEIHRDWQDFHDKESYTKSYCYHIQGVDLLNTLRIIKEQSNGKAIFLCWEGPFEFCHRHIVAEKIALLTGNKVPELTMEALRKIEKAVDTFHTVLKGYKSGQLEEPDAKRIVRDLRAQYGEFLPTPTAPKAPQPHTRTNEKSTLETDRVWTPTGDGQPETPAERAHQRKIEKIKKVIRKRNGGRTIQINCN